MFHSEQSPSRRLDDLYLRVRNRIDWIITKLTGNSPLSLPNAVAKSIKNLTQYGLCTQDGTPTPSAPVDIMCNNGALRMVDDELPSGYKRLLGISFDGNFHYKTGEYLTSDDDVTMTLDNLSSSGKNVFGSYNGANDKNFSLYIYGSTSGSYFRFGNQLKRPKYGSTGRRTITFGAGGTSGFAEDVSIDPDEFTTPANTYIGMLPNSSSAAYTGDIIGSILVGTRLEWIPCENDGGVIGYYERVNGNFIAPTGNGTPVSLGYDTSHLVLRVVGTHEVLTVSGKNLLNPATNITGKYIASSGVISNGDDAQYTDLIPVKAGETYVCSLVSGRNSGNNRWHAYDANGTWVKQLAYVSATGQQGAKLAMAVTIDSGISYVRLSYGITDTEAMICLADSSTQISADGYYVGLYTNNAAVAKRNAPIQSPYTSEYQFHGPAIVFSVLPGKIYAGKTNAVTNYTKIGYACYNNIEDVADQTKAVSRGEGAAFVAPDGANYAVFAYINSSSGVTFTFDEPYASEIGDYQPYVAPQIASVPMLLSVGDVKDEVELIAGTFTRRVTACLYDGTQPVGDVYMSTTGGKDAGAIIVYPLATPTTEQITGQNLVTNEGTNIVDVTANVSPIQLEVEYAAKRV